MSKVKIIEQAREVYWASTYQGKWEVDGKTLEFRYAEDSKGSSFYLLQDGVWKEVHDFPEGSAENAILNMCSEMTPSEWGSDGESFVYDSEDSFI